MKIADLARGLICPPLPSDKLDFAVPSDRVNAIRFSTGGSDMIPVWLRVKIGCLLGRHCKFRLNEKWKCCNKVIVVACV